MKDNQQGSGLVIVLVIFVLVAIGAAGYFVYQSTSDKSAQQTAKQNTQQDTTTPQTNPQITPEAKVENEDQLLKNYVAKLSAGVNEYWADNRGNYPSNLDVIRSQIKDDSYKDWKNSGALTEGKPNPSTIYYASGYECDPATNLMKAANSRSTAIVVLLASNTAYCS